MQAPIAELATANPEEFKALRATLKKGESIQKCSDICLTRCLAQPNVDMIKHLKESIALLDIFLKSDIIVDYFIRLNMFVKESSF